MSNKRYTRTRTRPRGRGPAASHACTDAYQRQALDLLTRCEGLTDADLEAHDLEEQQLGNGHAQGSGNGAHLASTGAGPAPGDRSRRLGMPQIFGSELSGDERLRRGASLQAHHSGER